MYDVSHKKEKLSMCMYDVIVKKAKIMRQKHKNMFESAVLIVKRAKTRANAREKHKNVFESVVLIVKRLKTRARRRNVRGVRTYAADAVKRNGRL